MVGLFPAISNIYSYADNPGTDKSMENFIDQHTELFFAIFILCVIVYLVLAIIGIIGRGALVYSSDSEIRKKSSNFKLGFSEGKKHFWNIFILSIILFLLFLISIIVLAVPVIFLFYREAYIIGSILAVIALFILIPLAILFSFAKTYGYIYIVLGKLSSMSALEAAYELFLKNIFASIIMGLLFIAVSAVMGAAIFLIILPVALFFLALGFGLYFTVGTIGAIAVIIPAALIFLAITLILRSIFEVFSQAVWILFFREIASPKKEELIKETEKIEKTEALPTATPAGSIKAIEKED